MDNLIDSIPSILARMHTEHWDEANPGDLRHDLYMMYADLWRRMRPKETTPPGEGREVYP